MLLLIQPRMLSAFTAARTHCRHVYGAVHQPPQILLFSVELFSSHSVSSLYCCWSKSLSRERLGICPSWISWGWSILLHQILPNFLVVVGFHGRVDDNSTPSLITFYRWWLVKKRCSLHSHQMHAFPRSGVALWLISEYSNEMSVFPPTFSFPKEEIRKKSLLTMSFILVQKYNKSPW